MERALARGAMLPIETHLRVVEDAGVSFLVREVSSLRRKVAAAGGGRADPFLPYDDDLFVADVSDTHFCLLNKYNAVANHALLVTHTYEEQTDLLTRRDWEALWACMGEFDALGFYNAGEIAGASQRHRHIQLVPAPIGAGPQ